MCNSPRAHDLHIETGRYNKPNKLPINARTCYFCSSNQVEDEKHFILDCSFYEALRKSLFSAIEEFYPDFNEMANDKQFELLMTAANGDADLCKVLSEYLIKCYDKREKIN